MGATGGSGLQSVQIDGADIATIVIYFTMVMGIGIGSMFGVKTDTEEGYFLAGRFMTWIPVGASLFATNIGSEHYIGLAGSGAEAGIGVGAFEFNALLLLPLLAFVFIPVYMASGAGTIPEYMNKRFGGSRITMVLSIVSLLMYIFTKNSVDMYSGALFIQQAIGWNLYLSVGLLLGMTVLSTIAGGLAAVIYTDTLQAIIMLVGAILLLILGMVEVGGFESLYYAYYRAIDTSSLEIVTTNLTALPNDCGLPEPDSWEMLRHTGDREMPWAGFVFGQTTASLWYWCADQMMVQRVLAAKNLSQAQAGCMLCALFKIVPFFAMVLPGMISRVLYPELIACSTSEACQEICESDYSCSNIAFPKLVLGLMPTGLRGLIIAVILSATMSDLSSTFNSASTLFTMDVYRRVRKQASTTELMIVGRISVVVVVAVGILCIPLVQQSQGEQLFIYIQSITSYLSPPIAATYLIALFWKRGNEKGAFFGLITGILLGVVRLALSFVYLDPTCSQVDERSAFLQIHYMYIALMIFVVTVIVNVIVSLLTKPLDEEMTYRTTFWTKHMRVFRSDDLDLTAPERPPEAVEDGPEPDTVSHKDVSCGKKVLGVVCGTEEDGGHRQLSIEEQKRNLMELTDISQTKFEFYALGAIGVFFVCLGTFLLTFFSVGWYDNYKPAYLEYIAEKFGK